MSDNIQVAIRVRPLIQREKVKNERELWKVNYGKYIFQESSPSEQYCFDRVFSPTDDNHAVYEDLCFPIVESVMQGFNGTIFAYGQTSSGKTFTMMGEHNGIQNGVIQFSITDVFKFIQKTPDREFLLRVSFLEIYNEKVYDLLSDKNEDLKLLEDSYGVVKVSGLLEKIVQTEEQIWEWMQKGQNKRRTGATVMNRNSSRSHSIFRMIIESRVKDEDAVVNVSQLNLVDLAGSENLKQTNAKGERFKEGVHINLSLSTLIQVISQLSDAKGDYQYINYRNSKLTRLLQNSLGGNALTAIICAVTPASMKETLSTITFAQGAKKIKNKPKVNEIFNEQALLKQYANQIKKLSKELQVSKEQGKELAEKTKQNENLKRQIEALKSKFVTQTGIAKSTRRETWGGHLAAQRMHLDHFAPIYKAPSNLDLFTLEEDAEGEQEALDNYRNSTSRISSCSSHRGSVSRNILNVETQTDFEEPIDYEELLKEISGLKYQLINLQTEVNELQDYTSLEKQCIKAENELQTENEDLKNEIFNLSKHLDELKSKSRTCSCSFENFQGPSAENCLMSRLSTSEENVVKACQTSPLKLEDKREFLEEQNKKLEQSNQDLSKKIIEIETAYQEQKDAFEKAQSEWNAKSQLILNELESKYKIELADINNQLTASNEKLEELLSVQERYSDLEEVNKKLRQKICNLETAHGIEIKLAEEKNKAAELELQTLTEKLEVCQKELDEIKVLFKECEIPILEHIKILISKHCELEESNESLKQQLCDLKSAHCIELKEAEERAHSELLTMTKDLEEKEKKLEEMQNQLSMATKQDLEDVNFLQEKCSKLVEYNSDLRKKITDIENAHWDELEKLEENFKNERADWETEILKKFKELETKHQKELNDLETRVSEEKFNERIQVYVKEACELREEVKHLKLSNTKLLSTIEELENINEKQLDQITKLSTEKDEAELAMKEKYERIITEYKSRQRQCHEINRQLKNKVCSYKEEIEKNQNKMKTNNCNEQFEKKITVLTQEKNDLIDKNKIASQEIYDLKMKLKKVVMDLDEQKKATNSACKMEDIEEKCKILSFELDQKEAKIISLESNNTRLVQEIKKLTEKLSSKHVPCRCEGNVKKLKLETHSDCGLKLENEKLHGKIETKKEEKKARKVSFDDQKENDYKDNENPNDNVMGAADAIKNYRLEGIIHKKDKELKRLTRENNELKNELLSMKVRPVNFENKNTEFRNPDLRRVPMSPLRDKNEDLTVATNVTPRQKHGVVPEMFGKHVAIRERYKRVSKPYNHPPKTEKKEVLDQCKQDIPSKEVKENKRPATVNEVVKMMDSDVPDCKQQ